MPYMVTHPAGLSATSELRNTFLVLPAPFGKRDTLLCDSKSDMHIQMWSL